MADIRASEHAVYPLGPKVSLIGKAAVAMAANIRVKIKKNCILTVIGVLIFIGGLTV